jgi:hypothetical protein
MGKVQQLLKPGMSYFNVLNWENTNMFSFENLLSIVSNENVKTLSSFVFQSSFVDYNQIFPALQYPCVFI